MLQESYFKQDAKKFVEEELMVYNESFLQKNATLAVYNSGNDPKIEVSFMGKEIPNSVIGLWREKMKRYGYLKNASLIILQNENTESFDQLQYMREFKRRDSISLMNKDERIVYLESELSKLSKYEQTQIPFADISKEAKINYEGLESFSYADKLVSNFNTIDTIPEFDLRWKKDLPKAEKLKNELKLKEWLAYKLKLDTLIVKSLN